MASGSLIDGTTGYLKPSGHIAIASVARDNSGFARRIQPANAGYAEQNAAEQASGSPIDITQINHQAT